MIYLLISQFIVIIFLFCTSILNFTSDKSSIKSKFCYFSVVFFNLLVPKITEKNKMFLNGIISIIISISICGYYSYIFQGIFNEKVFFAILIIIPTLFSFISLNFIDMFRNLKIRFSLYITKSKENIADEASKRTNENILKKRLGEIQSENIQEI